MNAPRPLRNSILLACFLLNACSSSGSSSAHTGGTTGGGGNGAPGACTQNALTIVYSPMYSAYDGVHTFQLPAIVKGIDSSTVKVTWSAADPSIVALEPDPTTGGVMLTMQKAGTTTVYAQAGNLCGAALLNITAATPDDWTAGSNRYNDGVVLPLGGGSAQGGASGSTATMAACTNCHGDTASGPYKDVAHTPTQTGGFSDTDLINIFEHGIVPPGGQFDSSIVPQALWQYFHQWNVGTAEKGVVVYLRSLTPAAQQGAFNLGKYLDAGVLTIPDGGIRRADGGLPGGGGAGGAGGAGGGGGAGGSSNP